MLCNYKSRHVPKKLFEVILTHSSDVAHLLSNSIHFGKYLLILKMKRHQSADVFNGIGSFNFIFRASCCSQASDAFSFFYFGGLEIETYRASGAYSVKTVLAFLQFLQQDEQK